MNCIENDGRLIGQYWASESVFGTILLCIPSSQSIQNEYVST